MYTVSGKPPYTESAPATAISHQPPLRPAMLAENAVSIPSRRNGKNAIAFTGACVNHAYVPLSANAIAAAVLAHRTTARRRSSK